jgi:DNA polymerase elongation subunit (family B)
VPDENGAFSSIYGNRLKSVSSFSLQDSQQKKTTYQSLGFRLFESDVRPEYRALETHYAGKPVPDLNLCLFDIETGFCQRRGFASPSNPFNPITAISFWCSWTNLVHTLVMPPKDMDVDTARTIVSEFQNTEIFLSESALLRRFFQLIEPADVLSGWNSTAYDIPYMVNRVSKVLGKVYANKFCLWDVSPRERIFSKYKKEHQTFDLVGRVHLDYLELFQKFTFGRQFPSFSLEAIGQEIVGEGKVPYEGSQDVLYRKDFGRFVAYSRQDVGLLCKIDAKLQFIGLANKIAHENCVLLRDALGSVKVSDNAVLLQAHSVGLIVPDRATREDGGEEDDDHQEPDSEENDEEVLIHAVSQKIAGAYVADPEPGIHEDVFSVDVNSLYPSVFRALNMSPETIVGQISQDRTHERLRARVPRGVKFSAADYWSGVFEVDEVVDIQKKTYAEIIFTSEDGERATMTAAEFSEFLRLSGYLVSANGTIFSVEKEGVIPSLLSRWYSERKFLQKCAKEEDELLKAGFLEISQDFAAMVAAASAPAFPRSEKSVRKLVDDGDVEDLLWVCGRYGLILDGNRIVVREKEKFAERVFYFDQRQMVKKIALNSIYGALTNRASRFYDVRLGQSCTLTGRCITRHMLATLNESIAGTYDHRGAAVVYGDTDSAYMTLRPLLGNETISNEDFVTLSDHFAEVANASFPGMLRRLFNVPEERGAVIRCGREVCARRALFIKKKRYCVAWFDKEGKPSKNPLGDLKIMGLETQRSDTSKMVQGKLKAALELIMRTGDREALVNFFREFREEFLAQPIPKMGTPRRVNGITEYAAQISAGKARHVPGHVSASILWNRLRRENGDTTSMEIQDGQKIIVCDLRENQYGFKSIAYPIDQHILPEWFLALPFDVESMVEKSVDQKIENIFSCLNLDLRTYRRCAQQAALFETI